jgi:hypothetical protein
MDDETPAVSTATALSLAIEQGISAPRVIEAEGLTLLQEEALLNEVFQTFVVENECKSLDYEAIRKFAIKIQMDDELCRELGGEPFSEEEILASESLDELCWIPDDAWLCAPRPPAIHIALHPSSRALSHTRARVGLAGTI